MSIRVIVLNSYPLIQEDVVQTRSCVYSFRYSDLILTTEQCADVAVGVVELYRVGILDRDINNGRFLRSFRISTFSRSVNLMISVVMIESRSSHCTSMIFRPWSMMAMLITNVLDFFQIVGCIDDRAPWRLSSLMPSRIKLLLCVNCDGRFVQKISLVHARCHKRC